MDRAEQLDSLVDRWQQRQREGRPIPPEELCRDDPDLLPELRSLIEALDHVERLLVPTPVARTPAATLHPDALGDRPAAPPGYEIHAELGRGGMGVVYKARQVGLNRIVALKMLLAGAHASPDDRRRFRREAEAVARLSHANIVQVYEVGEHEGREFLSLEYVSGGSLAEYLRGRALPAAEAAQLVAALARAIDAAHERGVVHRDLKPGNVLLAPAVRARSVSDGAAEPPPVANAPGSDLVPKISDFGLAKRLDDEFSRTHQGALMGTPAYMAPEQANGDPSAVGRPADVYALGAILYECLTGQVPFRAATLADLLDLVRHAEPVPPTRHNDRIPRDLETITLKCLQKLPARRYTSAGHLADDLARYLDGRPILARPVGLLERAVRWAKRRRALAALYAVSLLAVVALVGLGLWVSARLGAAHAKHEAVEARAVAAERLAEAGRFFGLLTQAREQVARARPGWTWRALDDLTQAARLPDAKARAGELRTEAARCLGAIDARLIQTLADTPRVTSIAWHPSRCLLAVGNRGGGLVYPCVVHLIDLDSPKKRRTLFLRHKAVLNKDGRPGPDIVLTLAFSPDGRRLAAGMRSGALHLWDLDAADDAPPLSRQAHDGSVEHVLFSRDGQSLYSISAQGVKRSTLAKLDEAAAYPGKDLYRHLAIHPRDGWVAVCDEGKTQRLHPDTLRPQGSPLSAQGRHFTFASDGRTLVQSEGRALRAWDAEGDRLLQTIRAPGEEFAHQRAITAVALSPDGTLLLTASDETRHVRLWDLLAGHLAADLSIGAGSVKLAFAPDGRSFAVTGDNRTLIYEVAGRCEQVVRGKRPGVVSSFALAADGSLACVTEAPAAGHGEVAVWPDGDENKQPVRGAEFVPWNELQCYPLSYIGKKLPLAVLGAGSPTLLLADPRGMSLAVRVPLAGEGRAILRAPDGRLWGAAGDEVCSWDDAGKVAACWKNVFGLTVRGVSATRAVAASREWVVAAGQDGDVRVLRAATGKLKQAAARNLARVSLSAVALSPGGGLAVVGSITGNLWVVAVPSAEVVAEVPAVPDRVAALDWSANDLVACACHDGTVTLYRHRDGDFARLLELRHDRPVCSVQLADNGKQLGVLLAGERGVRVWDLGRLFGRLGEMGLGL